MFNNSDYERDAAFERYTGNGMKIPEPPKPGEVLMCQICGKAITPEELKEEKNIGQRKRCFKWHIHPKCYMTMNDIVDRSVPGLIAERKKAEERYSQR